MQTQSAGLFEGGDGNAVFAFTVLAEAEFLDGGMPFKVLLDTASENAGTLSMNDAHLGKIGKHCSI